MLQNVFGLIYTGENNINMRDLTVSRSVSALPFGARYRCVDFILSSLVHSGITSVGVIAQKNYHSLMDHLGSGKEWDLHRKREGLFILPPFLTKDSAGVYRGSVDAFRSCLGYVRRCPRDYVVLSGGHTLFNMTFDEMFEAHMQSRADITIMYNEERAFNPEEQLNDLFMEMDEKGRVISMELDPYRPRTMFRSCDVMIMNKSLLEYLVEEAYAQGEYDFKRDVLLKKCRSLKICGWRYDGIVARMNSVNSYFDNSMSLLKPDVRADLFNAKHPIYTKTKDEVPAKYGPDAKVSNVIAADGCEILGTVENSILFRGARIGEGAVLKNCIVMQGTIIGAGCLLDHVILDKGAVIRDGRSLSGYEGFPIVIKKNANI